MLCENSPQQQLSRRAGFVPPPHAMHWQAVAAPGPFTEKCAGARYPAGALPLSETQAGISLVTR